MAGGNDLMILISADMRVLLNAHPVFSFWLQRRVLPRWSPLPAAGSLFQGFPTRSLPPAEKGLVSGIVETSVPDP